MMNYIRESPCTACKQIYLGVNSLKDYGYVLNAHYPGGIAGAPSTCDYRKEDIIILDCSIVFRETLSYQEQPSPPSGPVEDSTLPTPLDLLSADSGEHRGLIPVNSDDERIDTRLRRLDSGTFNDHKKTYKGRTLCARFLAMSCCENESCSFDHEPDVSDEHKLCLQHILRRQPCKRAGRCRMLECWYGHTCYRGGSGQIRCNREGCLLPDVMHRSNVEVKRYVGAFYVSDTPSMVPTRRAVPGQKKQGKDETWTQMIGSRDMTALRRWRQGLEYKFDMHNRRDALEGECAREVTERRRYPARTLLSLDPGRAGETIAFVRRSWETNDRALWEVEEVEPLRDELMEESDDDGGIHIC